MGIYIEPSDHASEIIQSTQSEYYLNADIPRNKYRLGCLGGRKQNLQFRWRSCILEYSTKVNGSQSFIMYP